VRSVAAGSVLGAVTRVDVDILTREVTGPVETRCFSLVHVDIQRDFALFKRFTRGFCGYGGGRAVPEHAEIVKTDIHFGGIKRHAGATQSGENAAPVGVFPIRGGLHQGGGGHDFSHALGVGFGACAFDADFQKFAGPFAVARNFLREFDADVI